MSTTESARPHSTRRPSAGSTPRRLRVTRRAFLGTTALGAAALLSSPSRVLGANEEIGVGVIGLGGQGGSLLNRFAGEDGVRIVGLCEPDQSRLDRHAQRFPQAQAVSDLRELLDNKNVDAVVIAACNHWHSLATIWAVQAGKDVYVEKPGSHNVWEGRKMVEAARKYDRVVQGGLQQRSDPMQDEVKEFLASGELGEMQFVRLNRFGVRGPIGKRDTPLAIPSDVNYDLWLGPADLQPIYRGELQYDWHWEWNTGNGELGNWGPHILDDCRNVAFNDEVTLPKRVVSGGGRFVWDDAGNTPNTHFVYYDTDVVPVVMAVHNLPIEEGANEADRYQRLNTRAFLVIQCENGYYAGGRGSGAAYSNDGQRIKSFQGDSGGGHVANFLAAVRSRKREELAAEIEQTHYSAAWAHLGNIAYRLGGTYNPQEAMERVQGYGPWEELVEGFEEHVRANGVDPVQDGGKLGPMLEVDVDGETFTGPTATPEAKALLTRQYRAPYVVPKEV